MMSGHLLTAQRGDQWQYSQFISWWGIGWGNAMVTSGTKMSPSKVMRALCGDEQRSIKTWAEHHVELSRE